MARAIHFSKELTMQTNTLLHLAMTVAVAAIIAAGTPVKAQSPPGPEAGGGEHHGPPPEAIAACKTSKLSQPCSFTSPRGAESGSCWQPDTSHPLACRPDRNKSNAGNGPAGNGAPGNGAANDAPTQRQGPPPESLAACKSHKLNDACSFTSARGAESGACFQPDASKPLACRPAAPR
jgi:hypothetical protein